MWVADNELDDIPHEIADAVRLEHLNLERNPLDDFPSDVSIYDMEAIRNHLNAERSQPFKVLLSGAGLLAILTAVGALRWRWQQRNYQKKKKRPTSLQQQ